MTTMQGYINAHCEAQRRDPDTYARFYDPDYDDDRGYTAGPSADPSPWPWERTPGWLQNGLQQYLELVDEDGNITPKESDEPFGHLDAAASQGDNSFFEVTSDGLYVPRGEKVARTALSADCFVVKTSFTFGKDKDETPGVTPRIAFSLVGVSGETREEMIHVSGLKRQRTVELREEDTTDRSGNPRKLVNVSAGISKPKTDPEVSDPVVREKVEKYDKWVLRPYARHAAGGLLRVVMDPELDERIKRVRLDASAA